jgi:replicative DNA helicase
MSDDPKDPYATTIDGFQSMPVRLGFEREDRMARGAKRLKFYVQFLDDYLRGILPHDLVLIGAPSGVGKTDLALNIGASNAYQKRRVHYFALEAEPRELERRTKYSLLSRKLFSIQHPNRGQMNYTDWLLGDLEHFCAEYNREADQQMLEMLSSMQTYYRGAKFTASDLQKSIETVYRSSDLIIVDHLHYIDDDKNEDNEAKALGDTVKTIRDVSLRIGVPIILVAHLRKRDQRGRQLVSTLDDFHGSSNVTKISTQAILIERAPMTPDKWYQSPTFITIPKDRRSGKCSLIAVSNFDQRIRSYAQHYALGRAGKGGEWEQIPPGDVPSWATHHKAIEVPT